MKILITGFEPFGESSINPSQMLVNSINNNDLQGAVLIKSVLPVDQAEAPETMVRLIKQHRPEAILAFGLAMGRAKISLERVALNLQDFRIPDNRGVTVTDEPIHPEGPAAYFSTLPLRAMLTELNAAGIPAELSLSAGAYLCNLVFYTVMHTLAALQINPPAGFIHLPALPQQAAGSKKTIPSMSFPDLRHAARILITNLVDTQSKLS